MEYKNNLTKLLNIKYPILSAPMAGVSGGKLAAAVSKAGGFGFIGAGYSDTDWLHEQLKLAGDANIGIGFITWQLAEKPKLLALALKKQPRAIMLSFGDPAPYVDKIKASGAKLICQVQTVEMAKEAAKYADIIVAQGGEAGGHGLLRGTIALVPAIVDAVAPLPVIAAGGIADGRGLAAALVLGAQGALLGTRFYACIESSGNPKAKELIVSATGDNTLRSNIFDYARGLDWPTPFTARTLQNEFSEKYKNQTALINKDVRLEYQQAMKADDFSAVGVFAGENVDLIHDILTAEEIINRLMKSTEEVFSNIF